MHRRSFLEAGLAAVGGSLALGSVRGQQPPSFEPLGSVDVPGAADAVPHPDSGVVYVAAGDGIAAVDVGNDDPEVVAEDRGIETETGEIAGIWDLWPWADRLIAAGPANPGLSAASGFALYDTTDPAAPERIAVYETEFYIHNASFEDGIVYLTGSGVRDPQQPQPLVMVDVSDDEPAEVGRFSVAEADERWRQIPGGLRSLHDVHVHDGTAYLAHWDAGTWLVDITDPQSPTVRSRVGEYTLEELLEIERSDAFAKAVSTPGNDHVTTVNEDATMLAVGEEAWAVNSGGGRTGGAGGVRLYDISDETDPRLRSRIDPPASYGQTQSEWFTTAHNLDIAGDRLYTSWYFGGVKIHDISDPANPEEIAWWRDPREAGFWSARATDDVVVAASANLQSKIGRAANATRDALYIFPDAAGEQPNPPSLTDPSATGANSDDGSESNGGTTDDGSASDGESDEQSENTGDSDGSGPGFGVPAALLAAAGAGYAFARRGADEH